jgi:hypothetical protein
MRSSGRKAGETGSWRIEHQQFAMRQRRGLRRPQEILLGPAEAVNKQEGGA